MKKKDISDVLKALRDCCKKNYLCRECELNSVCDAILDYSFWSGDDIKKMTNAIKDFIDSKEVQDNDN